MRNGYFSDLIRMTGIAVGQRARPASAVAIDTPAPQPLHVEETTFVPQPRQTRAEPAPTPTPLVPQVSQVPQVEVDRLDTPSRPGQEKPDSPAAAGQEPGTPAVQPPEVRETVIVDNAPHQPTETSHPAEVKVEVEKESLQGPPQPGERPGPVLKQPPVDPGEPGEPGEPVLHEYVEVVEVPGQEPVTPGTPVYSSEPEQGTASPRKRRVHSPARENKEEPRVEHREAKPGITLDVVRQWVAEPVGQVGEVRQVGPVGPVGSVRPVGPVRPVRPLHPGSGPLHESREFSLSIGTIAVTVEEPPPPAGIQAPAPVQTPVVGHRVPKGAGEIPSSRLGRHYVRIRS